MPTFHTFLASKRQHAILPLLGMFFLLLLGSSTLTSFSLIPIEKTPVSAQQQQLQKKEARLQKRLHQLQSRSTNTTKRQDNVKKRLSNVQQQQKNTKKSDAYLLGLLSMIAGILGTIVWVAAVFSSFALAFGGSGAVVTVGVLIGIALLLAITGIILSILYFSKRKQDPTTYHLLGFAIAGIIISSLVFIFGAILVFGALFG